MAQLLSLYLRRQGGSFLRAGLRGALAALEDGGGLSWELDPVKLPAGESLQGMLPHNERIIKPPTVSACDVFNPLVFAPSPMLSTHSFVRFIVCARSLG